MRTVQGVVGAFVALGALAVTGNALASGGGQKSEKGKAETSPGAAASTTLGAGDEVGVSGPERQAPRQGGGGGSSETTSEEYPFSIGLDYVLGFGKGPVVDSNGFTPVGAGGTGTTPAPTLGEAKITTYSFVAGLGYQFKNGLGFGLKVPFSVGSIASPENRGIGAFGNVELEAYYEHELSESLSLEYGLGVTLPTAQGTALPAGAVSYTGSGYDQSGFDRAAIQAATASARGYEENALYEIDRLGINPKLKLLAHGEKWRVMPWVKLEDLISTVSGAAHSYTGELILGVEGGYFLAPAFEPAVRVWTNIPVAGADYTAVGVVEPQLRFHVGEVTPVLGVILPFAGPLTDPQYVGVRAAIGGRF